MYYPRKPPSLDQELAGCFGAIILISCIILFFGILGLIATIAPNRYVIMLILTSPYIFYYIYRKIRINSKKCITYSKGRVTSCTEGFNGPTKVTIYLYEDKITFNDIQTIPLSRVVSAHIYSTAGNQLSINFTNIHGKQTSLKIFPNNLFGFGGLAKKINKQVGYKPKYIKKEQKKDKREPFEI
jgi:hypothetical protein